MTTSNQGRRNVADYLSGSLSLFALNNWSLEFGDNPDDANDLESMEIAGLVTELVDDLGTGTIDERALRTGLTDELERISTLSDGPFVRRRL